MWRSTLRALGAVLIWCASAGSAWASNAVAQPPAPVPLVQIANAAVVPLYGKSVYWMETDASLRVEQVEAEAATIPWQVRRREQLDRLHGGAVWLSFETAVPAGEHWYLEVGAAVYSQVQLYYRDRNGRWVVQSAGFETAVADWPVPGRLPTFALAADGPRPVRYWLRVEDERADFSTPVTLYREDALQSSREREQFLFGAYFGLAALLMLAALTHGLFFRDKAFLAFALYILLLASGQLGRAGVGAQYVWREWPIWNGVILALYPGAATAAALWFVKVVTQPVRLSRALDLGVWALIAALLAAVLLDLVIGTPSSMRLVLSLTGLSLVAVLSMVLWGWLDGHDANMRLVALGFAPVLVMALFPLARGLGLMPTSALTRSGLFFAAVVELPLLYYALHMRLLSRREGELRASALSRNDPLTGLPHRQGLIERLDSSLAHARAQKHNCALLAVRVSNLDAIAEEFGRDAAEKALVVAASHLRRTIVGFDMAARVGEREFALLVEAPVTPELVTSRAQQIVASGLRQVEALPAALTVKFHVTAAMLPDPQRDGRASLQWVLDALDLMNQDARKLIRPINFGGEAARA
jgi:diguanylate cyclase (GGDEF)-like protein